MGAVDFFYMSLGGGFLILVLCAVVITVQVWRILADVQSVTEDAAGVATDLATLKEGVKVAVINLVQNVLEKAKKKGGAAKKNDEEEEG
jgi:hypothetical protein